jgi:hypothetical protein
MNDQYLQSTKAERGMQNSPGAASREGAAATQRGDSITAPRRGTPYVTPTRSPVRHTGKHFRGKFYSAKNARHIKCESYLEVLIARLLEFLRNVRSYSEQPPALIFRVGRRRRRLTPDFIVHRLSGRDCLVEVKPAELAEAPELKAKFAAAAEAAAARGYRFVVLTERAVGKVASQNLEEMLAVRGRMRTRVLGTQEPTAEPKLPVALATAFAHGGSMSMSALLSLLGNGLGAHTELMTLLAFRVLAWNIDQQLESATRISINKEVDDEDVFA